MVVFRQFGPCHTVVVAQQQAHGGDNHVDGNGTVEAESLVGYQPHVLETVVLGKGIGDVGNLLVGPDEDGDLLRGDTAADHVGYGVEDCANDFLAIADGLLCPIIVTVVVFLFAVRRRKKRYPHASADIIFVKVLNNIGIGRQQLVDILVLQSVGSQPVALLSGGLNEELIVETDDAPLRTVVAVESGDIDEIVGKAVVAVLYVASVAVADETVYQPPVAVSPPVDALFDVADDERVAVLFADAVP